MADMKTGVLVVGAGPSGLSAALFLASRGHQVTIIDKNEARSDKSKAIGVQPGTLELLESAFGADMPREMVEAGIPAREVYFHNDLGRIFHIQFSDVPSRYNSLLMLKQSETERIFEERLTAAGVSVMRRHELTSLKQTAGLVEATVKSGSGTTSIIQSRYLIGCDGAHSSTRRLLGLEFEGGTYDGTYLLADLRVEWPWEYGSVRTFLSAYGAAAFFPLKGEQQYRLILIPRMGSKADAGEQVDLETVRRETAPFVPGGVRLSDPVWMTRFRVHHRMTDKMGEGRIFLCGDAAHIHSPVGAQGMNTGIHDALDLSWRIGSALREEAGPEIFEGFLTGRHRNAAQVVRFTDLAFRIVMSRESTFTAVARRYILPLLITRPFVQKRALRAISEIDVARRIIANIRRDEESRKISGKRNPA